MNWTAQVLCPGAAQGPVLRFDAPISFWGGICARSSRVVMSGHPQYGVPIHDRVVVIPDLVGSSSSSAVMLELLYKEMHPRALILGTVDAILPIGVLVAGQMGWSTIPVFAMEHLPFRTGDHVELTADGKILRQ
jgi:predicted aconitase with swiveling domain